jgi:hypothetical protein
MEQQSSDEVGQCGTVVWLWTSKTLKLWKVGQGKCGQQGNVATSVATGRWANGAVQQ